jgi:hypothetical protein
MAAAVLAAVPLCGLHAEPEFATQLARDCYVLKNDQLEPLSTNAFQNARLYIVYYSHIWCSQCPAVTKPLNVWREKIKDRQDIRLVFATRGENNNDELLTYLKKAQIKFAALDARHYAKYVQGNGEDHPFYEDADDGVPRFRFFNAQGNELNPRDYGFTNVYEILKPEQLEELSRKILSAQARQ